MAWVNPTLLSKSKGETCESQRETFLSPPPCIPCIGTWAMYCCALLMMINYATHYIVLGCECLGNEDKFLLLMLCKCNCICGTL